MRHSKIECPKCKNQFGANNINKHLPKCEGLKNCQVCGNTFTGKKQTCSYACSNTRFRSGENNGNWKQETYRTTCFLHHEKKCVICDEDKIVEVHHLNEDKTDNRPENLIPLCPTHHQYFHSKYRNLVEPSIIEYLVSWNNRL